MRRSIILQGCLTISLLFLLPVLGQDIASTKLGEGFVFDPTRSEQHGKVVKTMIRTIYQGMGDLKVEVGVYRYSGTFEEAIRQVPISERADVTDSSEQYAGAGLGLFLAIVESMPSTELDPQWLERAPSAVSKLGETRYWSYRVSEGEDVLKGEESLSPGDKIELYSIECQSPLVDFSDLRIVEGTWAIATRTTFTLGEASGMSDDSDYGWGEEDPEEPVDVGVALIPGALLIDPEETSYGDMLGEVNYLVEKPLEEVKSFYLSIDGKHCSIDDESSMAFGDDELPIVTIICLDHAREIKSGDDVTAISLFSARPEILSDLLGRNQGVWTILSFDRWVEEEY